MNELLLRTELTVKQREFVDASRSSGKVLLQLINDVLDLAKIEAGQMELDQYDRPIESLVYDVVDALHHGAKQKGLTLNVCVDPSMCVTARCDGNRLGQMLVNLIGNGIKFTTTGSVSVRVECVRWDGPRMRVRFSVTDTGVGIPAERRERLFRSFSQVDSSTTRRFGGTGLGLAIVKQLVEHMEGEIGVESTVGQGSTFWFEVPLQEAQANANVVRKMSAFAGTRVLVVSLVENDHSQILNCLRAWGCRAECVFNETDAAQAVTSALAAQSPFALLLVKIVAGSVSRFDLIEAISHRDRLPVIAFGSTLNDIECQLLQHIGVNCLLHEPVRPSALFDAMSRTLTTQASGLVAQPSDARAHENQPLPLTGHVLIAEDNRINQIYMTELLKYFGCTFDVAVNGDEALAAVQRQRYDVVLMDCQMPEMDGFTATREIRRLEAEQHLAGRIPIIALTANALKGDREHCLDAGMDDYLSKPVEATQLRDVLRRFLAEPPAKSPPAIRAESPLNQSDPIDLSALVNRCLNNQEFALRLLDEFESSCLDRADDIAAQATQAQFGTTSELAHALKGAAGMIGATALFEFASQVEASAQLGNLIATLELASQLRTEADRCCGFIQNIQLSAQRGEQWTD